MERKLHRRIPMHVVAHLYTSQGFITKSVIALQKYCIIPNPELLAQKRAEYHKVNKVN